MPFFGGYAIYMTEMEEKIVETLPPAALRYWRMTLLLSAALYALLCGVLLVLWRFWLEDMLFWPQVLLVMTLFIVPLIAVQWWHAGLRFRRTVFILDAQTVEVHLGVWFRHEIVLARSRVQYVDVQQAPFPRRFGLATLVIHTAGSMMPALSLPALSLAQAQKLRRLLVDGQ